MLQSENILIVNPVSSVIKKTILAAFTFLTALAIRDVFTNSMKRLVDTEKLTVTYVYAAFVIFITVLLAFLWQNSMAV